MSKLIGRRNENRRDQGREVTRSLSFTERKVALFICVVFLPSPRASFEIAPPFSVYLATHLIFSKGASIREATGTRNPIPILKKTRVEYLGASFGYGSGEQSTER